MLRGLILAIVVVLLACLAGCTSYCRCGDCGRSYKYRDGIPGQFDLSYCRACKGILVWCSEAESGWDEERYQRNGNEVWKPRAER